jgi:hypothetical protein
MDESVLIRKLRARGRRPLRKSREPPSHRWSGGGITWRETAVSSSVSVDRKLPRRAAKREGALAALIQLYPEGLPGNKVTVVISNTFNRRLRELGQWTVSQKTVQRALRDFHKPRG